jgi:hypothetical protein
MRQLILGLIFITTGAYSQADKFDLKNYPSDKFKITSDTTEMSGFYVALIVARPIVESVARYQGTKVWVQRLSNGKLTEKYLGEVETERGVYRPDIQPIKDTYIIIECGEYEGQVNLITPDGDFVTIPGYYYALNKPEHIYTRQANMDSLVYQYDLKNKKGTDLRGKNVTVDNLLFDEVEGSYWVK